jgi:hypothetical protein
MVCKSQIRKLPQLRKVHKSKQKFQYAKLRICNLRNLLAGRPPLQRVKVTEYTELQPLLSGVHPVMRVKSALAGEGGGVHAHPLSLHLPSPVKLQCTLQLRW